MTFFGNCRATGIGSLPATDVRQAVETVLACCPDLPHWPQLPMPVARQLPKKVIGGSITRRTSPPAKCVNWLR
jgi:hypothetical protein